VAVGKTAVGVGVGVAGRDVWVSVGVGVGGGGGAVVSVGDGKEVVVAVAAVVGVAGCVSWAGVGVLVGGMFVGVWVGVTVFWVMVLIGEGVIAGWNRFDGQNHARPPHVSPHTNRPRTSAHKRPLG